MIGDGTDAGSQDPQSVVAQASHKHLRREGDNVRSIVELDPKEPLTRWECRVKTMDGGKFQSEVGSHTTRVFTQSHPSQAERCSDKLRRFMLVPAVPLYIKHAGKITLCS